VVPAGKAPDTGAILTGIMQRASQPWLATLFSMIEGPVSTLFGVETEATMAKLTGRALRSRLTAFLARIALPVPALAGLGNAFTIPTCFICRTFF